MYFRELEIFGFKSFPEKTRIKLEPGITAIVGPNGCGKSNIADAIKWVLGEQSPRSLRGGSMEDVIFSGTDKKDPINLAEVSITLSNEKKLLAVDYNEVTITRRLFRSGESEYLLNKTPVRLKDIQDLLRGTGLGTSSYSIIEQGKVDMILSSKPEDRRYIFEEASGITRYKAKKREALRKLEHTENNLVRINDIIVEVKRQIGSIERHAKKAERYKEEFEKMKQKDIKLALWEYTGYLNNMCNKREKFTKLQNDYNAVKEGYENILELVEGYRKKLDEIIHGLTDVQREIHEISIFIEKGTHKIELNQDRISELAKNREGLKEEIKVLKNKIELQKKELEKIRNRTNLLFSTKTGKSNLLSEKEDLLVSLSREIESIKSEIKRGKNRILELVTIQTKIKNELIKLGSDLQNRKARLQRLKLDRESQKHDRDRLKGELEEVERLWCDAKRRLECEYSEINTLSQSKTELFQKLESVHRQKGESEDLLIRLEAKEELLKDMIKRYEGYDSGVKTVMDEVRRGGLSGVIGLLAEMIEIEPGYERHLEVVLGEMAKGVVVKNREAASEVISFLKSRGTPDINLLIYEDITKRDNTKSNICKKPSGDCAPLSGVIKVKDTYRELIASLLGKIYFTDDIEVANKIVGSMGEVELKCITKDCVLVSRDFIRVINRDTDEGYVSIIGRKRKLKYLSEEKQKIKMKIKQLTEEEDKLAGEMDTLSSKIQGSENLVKQYEIELANIKTKKDSLEAVFKRLSDELSLLELDISDENEMIGDITKKGEELNNRLNQVEKGHMEAEEFVKNCEKNLQEKIVMKEKTTSEISDIKSELNLLENNERVERRELERETDRLNEFLSDLADKENLLGEISNKISSLKQDSDSIKNDIVSKNEVLFRLHEEKEKILGLKDKASEELIFNEKELRTREHSLSEFRDSIKGLEMDMKDIEYKISTLKERIQQNYRLNLEELKIEPEWDINWEELKNEVDVLKIKLEKLGPVNLVAIDELKELEERHAFLTSQQEDLLRAKESLQKAITKINRTTREMFIETFEKIRVEFRNYFRMLFGGGHAELLLLDENDVLESGIDIVARPPGKRLQNLSLLSGGEKALTAIALLFAIFKIKPSPFCILDEIDAPLDESNIGRFLRILQEFLKISQFIIITHNKKTIQMADVLYGITMQEKGVSKIVSVRFANREESEKVLV